VSAPVSRREWLAAAAAAVALCGAPPARAADYASAAEALDAIDAFEVDVERYCLRLAHVAPAARPMLSSFARDRERHREHRRRLRERLGVSPASSAAASEAPSAALDVVREAQSALVYAHAESLPTLNDAVGVGLVMGDMVDLARHLTLFDLWIEAEAARG
jgi:hypothetical protein